LEGLGAAGEEQGILKDIWKGTRDGEKEELVARAARELQGSSACSVKSAEWSLTDGLLYFWGKIYVPDTSNLRHWIVALSHDFRLAGHSGRWKTLELVSRNYWWPQMSRYVGRYVSTCDMCLRTKSFQRPLTGELQPLHIPSAPWDTISVDFIVELPQSAGHNSIMVVVNSVTKHAHFVSTVTMISAARAAQLFLNHVWKHHGLPQKVVSDRGPQFVAEFTWELYQLLGIKLAATTAYHPQGDGQMEQVNQELEQYLQLFTNQRQDDLVGLLPFAEFQYNNQVHSSTQHPPFLLDTGHVPRMGFEPDQPRSRVESVNEFKDWMKDTLEEAKVALAKSKDNMALYYNRKRSLAPEFKTGDMVFLNSSNIQTTQPLQKLSHQRLGPFPIDSQVNNGAYWFHLPLSMSQLHPIFNVVKLSLAPPDPIPGRQTSLPPLPEIVDGKEERVVVLSSEFGRRCQVQSRARHWLQLVGCTALLMDALNFRGPDGVGESGVEPRRSLRQTRAS